MQIFNRLQRPVALFIGITLLSLTPLFGQNLPDRSTPVGSDGRVELSAAADIPPGNNENWQAGFANAGTDGEVRASAVYEERLFIGGDFRTVGGLVVNGLAMYDGTRWQSLDGGVVGVGGVQSLLVVGTKLYVGGQFLRIGTLQTYNIAAYDLETGEWSSLGAGIGGAPGGGVFSMTHDGEDLYVGGSFVVAGSIVAVNIARYDGQRWHRVGTGADRAVTALHYRDGKLYVAGAFRIVGDESIERFASYDVAEDRWEPLEGLPITATSHVEVITSDATHLYVGGRFSDAQIANIARRPLSGGAWDGMQRGLRRTVSALEPPPIIVRSIVRRDNELFVGGDFNIVSSLGTALDNEQPRDFAVWDLADSRWSKLPRVSAITGTSYPATGPIKSSRNAGSLFDFENFLLRFDQTGAVNTMAVGGDGRLFIGGDFDLAGPATIWPEGVPSAGAIIPDPEAVLSPNITALLPGDELFASVGSRGLDNNVTGIADAGDHLYVGGTFVRAGDNAVGFVARYEKATGLWFPMSGGLSPHATLPSVEEMIIHDGQLLVGGAFVGAGGTSISGLARYDRQSDSWSALGGRSFVHVTGFSISGNLLAVVGSHGLAIWDGTMWEDVPTNADGLIHDVAFDGFNIYVVGSFGQIGGLAASNVARYNPQVAGWTALGDGLPGPVHAVEAWEEHIYFGGDFRVDSPYEAIDIVRYDRGTGRFGSVAGGLIPLPDDPNENPDEVTAIHRGRYGLYVAGRFRGFGVGSTTNRASNIALFDGDIWRTLANGVVKIAGEGRIDALDASETELFVGGLFDLAGQKGAGNVASWVYPEEEPGDRPQDEDQPVPTPLAATPLPDDRFWDDRFDPGASPSGVNDEVFALATSNDTIYAAGAFTRAVGLTTQNIAEWDGQDWVRLQASGHTTDGIDGFVFALALDGDLLYVGGQFDRAGDIPASGIALWNRRDRSWQALGDGLDSDGGSPPFIAEILIDGTDIYVAGSFSIAGGSPVTNIARWDGSTWHDIGGGVEGTVNALAMYNGDLYAAGTISQAGTTSVSNIARFDGTTWSSVGNGVEGFVNDLAIYSGQLLIVGGFSVGDDETSRGLAAYDGTSITPFTHQTDQIEEARSIFVENDRIYVGGAYGFTPNPSITEQRFATGTIMNIGAQSYQTAGVSPWSPLGGGVDGPVNAIASSGGNIVVAGSFVTADVGTDEIDAASIVLVDPRGRNWQRLVSARLSAGITAMSLTDGTLYGIGDFAEPIIAGYDGPTHQIARLGGSGWRRTDGNIEGRGWTIEADGDSAYIGGQFIVAETSIAVNALVWDRDNESFRAISPGSGMANISGQSAVYAIEQVGDDIFFGGRFSVADTILAANIVRYHRPTNTWHPLADGLNGAVRGIALTESGMLYAAGEFVERNGDRLNGVARWDGASWHPLADGAVGNIKTIAATDEYLYIGGTFDTIAGIITPNVARYHLAEGRWEAVGNGLASDFLPAVEVLKVIGGRLFAGGFFKHSGADSIANVARWDDWTWSRLGSGVDFPAYAIEGDLRDVYFGGTFLNAGGRPSPFIALWHDPTLSVTEQERPSVGEITGGPNPFVTEFRIDYELPRPDRITIVVVDLQGRDIARLYEGPASSGTASLIWQPQSDIPSGTYIIRLTGKNGSVSRKIIRH